MKKLVLFFCAGLLFFSCSNNTSLIKGTFSQTVVMENGFSLNPEEQDVFAICHLERKTALTFENDNSYSFHMKQVLKDVQFQKEVDITENDLSVYLDQELTIIGKYVLNGNRVTITNEKVVLPDGREFEFGEYQSIDPAVGEQIQIVKYSVDDKELTLEYGDTSITYFRN